MPGEPLAPAYTSISVFNEEPRVTLDVAGKKINFLLDTGATYSVLNPYTGPLSSNSRSIMGVEGKSKTCFYMPLITCQFESQILKHSSLITPQCPIPLLGRDLLARLGAILKFQKVPDKVLIIMVTCEDKKENNIPEQILQGVDPLVGTLGFLAGPAQPDQSKFAQSLGYFIPTRNNIPSRGRP